MFDPSIVLSTFGLVFVAEMGDKTQLMTMTLAHRYRPLPVLAGAFAAFALLNVLAVVVGEALFRHVPREAVLLCAGGLFLVFAWKSWCDGGDAGEDDGSTTRRGGVFAASFLLIFVAELGDKTQLAMVALAASLGSLESVFLGGTLALWLVALIGVAVGRTLLTRIPARGVHRAGAVMFLVFGVLAIANAVVGDALAA